MNNGRQIIVHSCDFSELSERMPLESTAGYAGYVPTELSDTEREELTLTLLRAVQTAKPRACYTFLPITINQDEGTVDFDGAFTAQSVVLCRHLNSCTHAVLLTATIGLDIDRFIEREGVYSLHAEYIANAAGTALIEEYSDMLCDGLADKFFTAGFFTTDRFGLGYGDFSLSLQKTFLDVTEAGKRLSIALTAGNLMLPRKTITAVIGVKPKSI